MPRPPLPSLLATTPALPDLFLAARALADSLHHGRHPSSRRGASSEFYDFRAYAPGDPARLIDWRAYARTDRAYLRRFHHESQLTITIVLDASASMRFAGTESAPHARSKFRVAQELAAATALLATSQSDRAALIIARSKTEQPPAIEPSGGPTALRRIIAALEEAQPDPISTARTATSNSPLPTALRTADAITPRAGLVIVLSDALDDPVEMLAELARLRHAASRARRIALVQILAPEELDIAPLLAHGAVRFTDPESRQSAAASTRSRQSYASLMHAHNSSLRSALIAMSVSHALCITDRSPIDALREAMAR